MSLFNNKKEKELNDQIFNLKNLIMELNESNNQFSLKIDELIEKNNDLSFDVDNLSEIIKTQNNASNENLVSENNDLKKQINYLKQELSKQDDFIKSTPQLSRTGVGRSTSNGKIIYRNWSVGGITEYEGLLDKYWFSQFINHRFPIENFKINLFSVWNNLYALKENLEGKKVFFTAECMKRHQNITDEYGSHAMDYVDLALGFEHINHPKYLRFPYWITRTSYPKDNDEAIERMFESWNSSSFDKIKNVAVINAHDKWNTRYIIANDIEKYTSIDYAGNWRKNTTELVDKFNNNKIEYLKQFKFNICAENQVDDGYVTEKIFDAIKADCIPLYIGGGKEIEPNVLNEKAILRWHEGEDNSDTVELFKNLLTDEESYKEFKETNVLLDSAPKYVINKLHNLEKRFEKLVYEN